jgi:3-oxoadipate enol-lactonase
LLPVPAVNLVSSADGPADAPVLILGNPIGTTRQVWDRQLPVLARQFRVLRLEWRGHGVAGAQSDAPAGPYTIAELGTDVLTAVNHYGVTSFGYAGVSLGGMVGLWLAANAAERVTSLAVCCAALEPLPTAESWRERAALVRRPGGLDALADVTAPRWFTPSYIQRSPAEVSAVLSMLRGTAPEGYAGCAEAIAALDLAPLLGAVQAPTLVLSGAEDPAAPPYQGAITARGIAGSHLTVFRGASHFAHYETPGPVTNALVNHFTRTLS